MSTPHADPSTLRAVADTVFVVTRDTLYINRPDTLIATLQTHSRSVSDWTIAVLPSVLALASFVIVVHGWRVAHANAIKQAYNNALREAARFVSEDFIRYQLSLLEVSAALTRLYRNGQFDGRWKKIIEEEVLKPSMVHWVTTARANSYMLKRIAPELESQLNELLEKNNVLLGAIAQATDDRQLTTPERIGFAAETSRETQAQHDHIDELREKITSSAHDCAFHEIEQRKKWWQLKRRETARQ